MKTAMNQQALNCKPGQLDSCLLQLQSEQSSVPPDFGMARDTGSSMSKGGWAGRKESTRERAAPARTCSCGRGPRICQTGTSPESRLRQTRWGCLAGWGRRCRNSAQQARASETLRPVTQHGLHASFCAGTAIPIHTPCIPADRQEPSNACSA